ncbi:MAG: peptidoglycan recognition protein family protein [Actinomycetota bacterium]|nr:peptidoglycan recognition protein family protein [Actinomycetota bacterium]
MCESCGNANKGLSRRELLGAVAAGVTLPLTRIAPAPAGAREIEIICKWAWGGRAATGEFHRHTVRRLTVHHSGVRLTDNRDVPERLRNYQRGHQAQGWPDIAYHLIVDRRGNIYKGRPFWARGDTRTDYDPRGHLLVMCEGNFSQQRVSDRQVRALVAVLAWAARRFEVPIRTIRGHRFYAATECPGDDLNRRITGGAIRRRVRRSDRVTARRLCGDAGRQRVRAIERGDA